MSRCDTQNPKVVDHTNTIVVQDADSTLIHTTTAPATIDVVAVGPPGESGVIQQFPAAAAITKYAPIYLTATGARVANATQEVHAQSVIGIALNAADIDEMVSVRLLSIIDDPSWTWTPNLPILVGLGTLAQTVPVGAKYVKVLGTALSATRIVVLPQTPVYLA